MLSLWLLLLLLLSNISSCVFTFSSVCFLKTCMCGCSVLLSLMSLLLSVSSTSSCVFTFISACFFIRCACGSCKVLADLVGLFSGDLGVILRGDWSDRLVRDRVR